MRGSMKLDRGMIGLIKHPLEGLKRMSCKPSLLKTGSRRSKKMTIPKVIVYVPTLWFPSQKPLKGFVPLNLIHHFVALRSHITALVAQYTTASGSKTQELKGALEDYLTAFIGLTKNETYVDASHGFVNVKDVVEAHIRALEKESASGRYFIVEGEVYLSEILSILKEAYPTLRLPSKCVGGEPYMPRCKFSRERAESLDIKFTPLEATLKEMMESFKEKQFIRF